MGWRCKSALVVNTGWKPVPPGGGAAALQSQFEEDLAVVTAEIEAALGEIEALSLRPKKANIAVRAVVLAWVAA